MLLSKLVFLTLVLFMVVACSNHYSGSLPVSSSDIAFYKGRYTITLETNKNVYDMYVNYDSSVKYKLSTDKSYITVAKSDIKYNSLSNFFLLILNKEQDTFTIKFKDKNNMDVKLLNKYSEIVDSGFGIKY